MLWENYFTKRDLQNGKILNDTGAVSEIELIGSKLKAKVKDKDTYNIEVTVNDSDIERDYTCHCDRFKLSGRCPHIVAALSNWFEEYNDNRSYAPGNPLDNPYLENKSEDKIGYIREIVTNSINQDKDNFLTGILDENKKMLADFLILAKEEISEEDMFLISDYIEEMIEEYCSKRYNWRREEEFAYELGEIFDLIIKPLYDKGYVMEAFNLNTYLYDIIDQLELDERKLPVKQLEEKIISLWNQILSNVSEEDKKRIIEWFISRFAVARDTITGKFTREVFTNEFNDEEFVKMKLDVLNELLSKENERPSFSRGYNLESLINRFFTIAQNSQNSDEIVEEFAENNQDNLEVKRAYYDYLKQRGYFDKASKLIDELLGLTQDKPFLKEFYLKERKNIFSEIENEEEEIKTLENLAFNYETDNFDYAAELKEKLPEEEWRKIRQQLMQMYMGTEREEKFLDFLADYKEMLNYSLRANDFKSFINHFELLLEAYPAETLETYAIFLDRIVESGKMRKVYQEVTDHLEKMMKLENGEEKVRNLVDSWESKYEKRIALLDELGKFKERNY